MASLMFPLICLKEKSKPRVNPYLPVLASCFAFFEAFFFFRDGIVLSSYIVVKLKRFFNKTICGREE